MLVGVQHVSLTSGDAESTKIKNGASLCLWLCLLKYVLMMSHRHLEAI